MNLNLTIRMIAWLALWHLLTPVNGYWEDALLFGIGFALAEWMYRFAKITAHD